MKLLMDRITKSCSGEVLERPPPFQSFVSHVASRDEAESKHFWCQQFDGLEADPFPGLPRLNYQPRIDQAITHEITNLSWPTSGITASSVIRAALSLIIANYTNSSEALFGVTTVGRQAHVPGISQMTGPTIATTPSRIAVYQDSEQTIMHFLQRVQQQATEITEREQVGLQHIRRFSDEANRACQFQTLLDVHFEDPSSEDCGNDGPFERSSADGASRDAINAAFSTFSLQILCRLKGDGLMCQMSFDSQVISGAQVSRMAPQFEHMLRILCETASDRPLATINLLCEQDRETLAVWNGHRPAPDDSLVHHMIEKRAASQSSAPAICAWNGQFSYGELEAAASRYAQRLVDLGVGPEVVVPLFFEKSMWTPVAMLAVMKAGGASVVMDMHLPQERLRSIISQIEPVVVMLCSPTQRHRAIELRTGTAEVLVVDQQETEDLHFSHDLKLNEHERIRSNASAKMHGPLKPKVALEQDEISRQDGALVANDNIQKNDSAKQHGGHHLDLENHGRRDSHTQSNGHVVHEESRFTNGRHGPIAAVQADKSGPINGSMRRSRAVQPSDRLYLIYTSGSTGVPKGAVITHGNFSSAIRHQQERLLMSDDCRVYDFVSYAFDVMCKLSNVFVTCFEMLTLSRADQGRTSFIL